MSAATTHCPHLNEIDDFRNGDVICVDCGLIIDKIYVTSFVSCPESDSPSFEKEYILEILNRLNIPYTYSDKILQKFNDLSRKEKNCNRKLEILSYSVYEILNEYNIPISLKDICSVSGISTDKLFSKQHCATTVPLSPTLEKYCLMMNLSYQDFIKIEQKLPCELESGHNPLTIIGSLIYKYSKENNLNLSIKHIANTLSISVVSIQRFLKRQNDCISFRS